MYGCHGTQSILLRSASSSGLSGDVAFSTFPCSGWSVCIGEGTGKAGDVLIGTDGGDVAYSIHVVWRCPAVPIGRGSAI